MLIGLALAQTTHSAKDTLGKIPQLKPITKGPVQVVTTTNFITDVAQQIGGARVKVQGLMGAGVDPHLYKASAGDVRKLAQANLVLYGGLFLEGKMAELLEKNPRAIAISDGIPRERLIAPKGGFAGQYTYDPHVWFDVELWKYVVAPIRDALSKLDPAGTEFYQERSEAYLKQLGALDTRLQKEFARVPKEGRVLITSHDAFSYFGRKYGFEVRGLQGVSTVVEAGAKDVQALAEFIAARKIRAVFVESSISPKALQAVVAATRAKGWSVSVGGELFSDAAGKTGTPEGTYLGMVEANMRIIVKGLLGLAPQ
jgi:manganese/zinc/iron transport system substrate-binding protein